MPTPQAYPVGGFDITLAGTKTTYDARDGSVTVEDITYNINVFKNTETGNWDLFFPEADDWAKYFDDYDESTDTYYQTTKYSYPAYSYNPVVPVGIIRVSHVITYGSKFDPPIEVTNTDFMLHIYV